LPVRVVFWQPRGVVVQTEIADTVVEKLGLTKEAL